MAVSADNNGMEIKRGLNMMYYEWMTNMPCRAGAKHFIRFVIGEDHQDVQ